MHKVSILFLLGLILSSCGNDVGSTSERKWTVPYSVEGKQGDVRLVLMDPKYRKEQSLRELGDRFKSDFESESWVKVLVFDDSKALKMYPLILNSPESLNNQDTLFYEKHFIGNYTKNQNSGFHSYTITLEGLQGKQIDVKY